MFCRAFVRAVCEDDAMEVPSPTFLLLQSYDTPAGLEVHHFDLYRLEGGAQLYANRTLHSIRDPKYGSKAFPKY